MKKYNEKMIGQTLYFVSRRDGSILEYPITYITIDADGYKLHTTYGHLGSSMFQTLSKAKADRVSKNYAEFKKREDIKYSDSRAKYKFMVSELPKLDHLIGKRVLVKSGSDKWVKTIISRVFIVDRYSTSNHQLAFTTKDVHNKYLLSREGKNWKFWTELDELELEKNKLQSKIDEINAKIKFEEEKKK